MVEELEIFPGIFNAQMKEVIRKVHDEKMPYDYIYSRVFIFLQWARSFSVYSDDEIISALLCLSHFIKNYNVSKLDSVRIVSGL